MKIFSKFNSSKFYNAIFLGSPFLCFYDCNGSFGIGRLYCSSQKTGPTTHLKMINLLQKWNHSDKWYLLAPYSSQWKRWNQINSFRFFSCTFLLQMSTLIWKIKVQNLQWILQVDVTNDFHRLRNRHFSYNLIVLLNFCLKIQFKTSTSLIVWIYKRKKFLNFNLIFISCT